MSHRLTSILVLAVLAACGGMEIDEDDALDGAASDGDVGENDEALRGAYDYRCSFSPADQQVGGPAVGYLRHHGTVLTLSARTNLSDAAVGTYDPGYTRQPTKARFKNFSGSGPFLAPSAVLVPKALRTGTGDFKSGGRGGYVTVQYSGESFASISYYCKRIAALTATGGSAPAPSEMVTAEGLQWFRADADGMLRVAHELSAAALRSDVHLTSTAANAIVANRPYASLSELADVPGIGVVTLRNMRIYAAAQGWSGGQR